MVPQGDACCGDPATINDFVEFSITAFNGFFTVGTIDIDPTGNTIRVTSSNGFTADQDYITIQIPGLVFNQPFAVSNMGGYIDQTSAVGDTLTINMGNGLTWANGDYIEISLDCDTSTLNPTTANPTLSPTSQPTENPTSRNPTESGATFSPTLSKFLFSFAALFLTTFLLRSLNG